MTTESKDKRLKTHPGKVKCWESETDVLMSDILSWCVDSRDADTLLVLSVPTVTAKGKVAFNSAVDQNVKLLFGKSVRETFLTSGWPGTEVSDGKARAFVIDLRHTVAEAIVSRENRLFGWLQHRDLPEDFALFVRGAEYPVFFSSTHESEAWILSVTDDVPKGFRRSSLKPEHWRIWNDPYFCLRG